MTQKGFVFALFFLSFFTLLLGVAVYYDASVTAWERTVLDARRVEKASFAADDVAWDLKKFYGLDTVAIAKTPTNSSITISSAIPSNFSDPASELSAYKQFLQGAYKNQAHSNASLAATGNHLFFTGLNADYSWNNESRNAVRMAGGNAFAYTLRGALSGYCDFPACPANITGWSWIGCGGNAIAITLDIRDAGNTPATVSGATTGCVSPSSTNGFFVPAGAGTLYVSAGSVSGTSPAIALNVTQSLSFSFTLESNFSSAPDTRAVLPASLSVDGQNYAWLAVDEK
ncbi:MAG: hypothetical protein NTY90_01660 [Candidatus Micrarchaeota archaeon]|nr:hypothetical protein [Candidatus Micrarchaeota archaeon]